MSLLAMRVPDRRSCTDPIGWAYRAHVAITVAEPSPSIHRAFAPAHVDAHELLYGGEVVTRVGLVAMVSPIEPHFRFVPGLALGIRLDPFDYRRSGR
jgi:hypothetical protein